MRRVAALVFILLTSFALSLAQSTNASLAGRITDPANALIVDAKVVAISAGTNLRFECMTNGSGEYHLASLPPTSYRLEIEKSGFKKLIKPDVVLHVQDALRLDLQMTLGDVSETVMVESGAPVVNGTTPLYRWIIDLATKAQEIGEIKGIIFHQGESNSGQQAWLGHVETLVTSLRSDLDLDPAKVPFIAGELPRTGCCAGHNTLVQQIPDYVDNGHWVSSGPMEDGTVLDDRGDGLHWSTFSVIEMGKRYAAKMLEVQ